MLYLTLVNLFFVCLFVLFTYSHFYFVVYMSSKVFEIETKILSDLIVCDT